MRTGGRFIIEGATMRWTVEALMKILVLTLLAVTVVALSGVALVWIVDDPPALPLEIAKACLNVLTAAVIVQLIAFIVARAADNRKLQAEEDAFRRATLTRLNTAFTGIKGLRREARSKLTADHPADAEPHFARPDYNRLMEQVNAIQLDLELLAKDIETSHGIFSDSQSIYINVGHMEEYLNRLVDEWEGSGRRLGRTDKVALSSAPALKDYSAIMRSRAFVRSWSILITKPSRMYESPLPGDEV